MYAHPFFLECPLKRSPKNSNVHSMRPPLLCPRGETFSPKKRNTAHWLAFEKHLYGWINFTLGHKFTWNTNHACLQTISSWKAERNPKPICKICTKKHNIIWNQPSIVNITVQTYKFKPSIFCDDSSKSKSKDCHPFFFIEPSCLSRLGVQQWVGFGWQV